MMLYLCSEVCTYNVRGGGEGCRVKMGKNWYDDDAIALLLTTVTRQLIGSARGFFRTDKRRRDRTRSMWYF